MSKEKTNKQTICSKKKEQARKSSEKTLSENTLLENTLLENSLIKCPKGHKYLESLLKGSSPVRYAKF